MRTPCYVLTRRMFLNYGSAAATNKRLFEHMVNSAKPGKLTINSSVDTKISPVALTSNQTTLKVEVKLLATSEMDASRLQSLFAQLQTEFSEGDRENEMNVQVPDEISQPGVYVQVAIPHHYSIQATGRGKAELRVSSLECDSTQLTLESGNCQLINMKVLDAVIKGGNCDLDITKGFVGNMKATIEKGNFTANKLQGQTLMVDVCKGDLHVDSIYAHECTLHSQQGDIIVNNCHGLNSLSTRQGDIKINSVDGALNAHTEKGNLDVHLTDFADVKLTSTAGNADISVPETAVSSIDIKSAHCDIDDSLILDVESGDGSEHMQGTLGATDGVTPSANSLVVKANSVSLKMMDWITSQKIKFSEDPH